jgi:hypothetical protein
MGFPGSMSLIITPFFYLSHGPMPATKNGGYDFSHIYKRATDRSFVLVNSPLSL